MTPNTSTPEALERAIEAQRPKKSVSNRARIITLKTYAPRAFYVLEDGTVYEAHPPWCAELDASHATAKTVDGKNAKKLIDMQPRLLSRRDRRAALRAAGYPWPTMGTAPARHAH